MADQAIEFSSLERIWTTLRRNNKFYATNKIISVLLATCLAVYTLTLKYYVSYFDDTKILVIYWFMFIYYSATALDELLEVYSVFAMREKGALGLLFEMNYFLGIANLVLVFWAYHSYSESDFYKVGSDG